ncbi:MAG: protein kinase [Myxococcota bacterium]
MKSFGTYQLVRLLGTGGTGEVHEAVHAQTGRTVALKRLFPHVMRDEVQVNRFLREFRAASRVQHGHVVRVYDVGRVDGVPFFTMELIDGETLRRHVERGGLGVPRVANLAHLLAQVADALATLHAEGLAHRDIKPDNVLMRSPRDAVLCDFGLARGGDEATVTQKGELLGTWRYLAPEVIEGELAGPPADVYALGVMAFELCAGRPPFQGDDAVLLVAHVETPAPHLRTVFPDVDPQLAQLVDRLLAKSPASRPTAAQVAELLGKLGGDAQKVTTQVRALPRSGPAAFVGRERELTGLMGLLENVQEPRLAVLSGAEGMGKSRVLAELSRRAQRAGHVVVSSQATHDVNLPYQLWRAPVGALARRLRMSPPDFDNQRALFPAEHRAQVWRQVRAILEEAARRKPLVLLLDDADLADELSLAVLRRMQGPDVRGVPLVVMAAAREAGAVLTQLVHPSGCHHVTLAPLSVAESQALFRASTTVEDAAALERTDVSDGIPARVVAAAHAYAADGESTELNPHARPSEETERLAIIADAPVLTPSRTLAVPGTTLRVAPALAVEWTLAVLESRVPVVMLLRVLGLSTESPEGASVLDGIQQLMARGAATEDSAGRVDFSSDARRAHASAAIPNTARTALHRRVAEVISARADASAATAEVVAYHLIKAGQPEEAVDHLAQAAEAAVAVWAPEKALSLVGRGLDALALREPKDSGTTLQRAARVDAARTAALELILLQVLQARGSAATYFQAAHDVLAVMNPAQRPGLASDVEAHLAEAALQAGRWSEALNHSREALLLARKARDPLREADRALLSFRVRTAANQRDTRGDLALALHLARRSRDAARMVPALIQCAVTHLRAGRPRTALRPAERAVRLGARRATGPLALAARRVKASALLDLDERTRALDVVIGHVADTEAAGFLQEGAEGLLELARCHRNGLELEASQRALQKVAQVAEEMELRNVLLACRSLQLHGAVLAAVQGGTLREFCRDEMPTLLKRVRDLTTPQADPWINVDLWFHEGLPRVLAGERGAVRQLDLIVRAAANEQPRRWFERKACYVVLAEAVRLSGSVEGARELLRRVMQDEDARGGEVARLAGTIVGRTGGEKRGS